MTTRSFLPHGTAADGNAADQPIYLTAGPDNPNGAVVRFLVDGATTRAFSDYQRIVFLFDAGDPDAMASAREAWKAAKADARTRPTGGRTRGAAGVRRREPSGGALGLALGGLQFLGKFEPVRFRPREGMDGSALARANSVAAAGSRA